MIFPRLEGPDREPDGRLRLRFEVPAASPFFAGHFPGHPILPGIAHLALAAGGAPVAEISTLKLRHPVHPGDVLDLRLHEPGEDGVLRFELRRGEEPVSNGVLRLGGPGVEIPGWVVSLQGATPSPDPRPQGNTAQPGVFNPRLIPHAPPARLVRDVLEATAESLTGIAEIPPDNPFVQGGLAPAFVGLEAAAQGAAVLEALGRKEGEGPRIGYLVGIRNARFQTPSLPAGRPFPFTIRLSGSAPPLSIYEIVVPGEDGGELLRGSVNTYLTA